MESSEDSFTWTSTSSISEDSDTMVAEDTMEEPESGKSYKKKLHKRLFEGHEDNPDEFQRKREKKKIKEEDSERELDARVKVEPLHDSYLELRVKQEQASAPSLSPSPSVSPHKVKKRQRTESSDCDSSQVHVKKLKKKKKSKESLESVDSHEVSSSAVLPTTEIETASPGREQQPDIIMKKEKRKKKSKSLNGPTEEMIIEEKFEAEETVVETRSNIQTVTKTPISNKKDSHFALQNCNNKHGNSTVYPSKELVSDESSSEESAQGDHSRVNNHSNQKQRKPSVAHSDSSSDSSDTETWTKLLNGSSSTNKVTEKTSQRTFKISDRIMFEDDLDVRPSEGSKETNTQLPLQLRHFLKVNRNLKQCAVKPGNKAELDVENEEIWLVKCPHEIDLKALKDNVLLIDNKCKMKVSGQTYDGCVTEGENSVPILTLENPEYFIKNIPITGTVSFRKRIPKPHFMEDNVMANNQTNFIPLPDTKCRHPLFGADYKRAIKIPSSVKARLRPVDCETVVVDVDSKKKKKHKKYIEEVQPEVQHCFKDEGKRKKRKRKSVDDEETAPKKKRVKQDLTSVDTWESEKAIEESLFNF